MKPYLVILAAGESRRLGACKALVDLGGRTPLERLLEAGSGLEAPPLVISGAHAEAIAGAVGGAVEVAFNPLWAEGRTGGIRLAARLRPGRDLCLAPVDVPLVEKSVFEALASAWEAAGAPPLGWLAPRLGPAGELARHGHPVVVGRRLALLLEELAADAPLSILRSRSSPLLSVQVQAPEILDDLDAPEDLERLRARLRKGPRTQV